MNISDTYSHLNGEKILLENGLFSEIRESINISKLSFSVNSSIEIKNDLYSNMNRQGWADKVRIDSDNRLTISFLKNKIGLCIQLGNVARTYADILKLDYMGNTTMIKAGCIIVPGSIESKKLGANYANFDRLAREVQLFEMIINTPLLIISLSD